MYSDIPPELRRRLYPNVRDYRSTERSHVELSNLEFFENVALDAKVTDEEFLQYLSSQPPLICVFYSNDDWSLFNIEFGCPSPMNTENVIAVASIAKRDQNIDELSQRDHTNGMRSYEVELCTSQFIMYKYTNPKLYRLGGAGHITMSEFDLRTRYHIAIGRGYEIFESNESIEIRKNILRDLMRREIDNKYNLLENMSLFAWLYSNCRVLGIKLSQITELSLQNPYDNDKDVNDELVEDMYNELIKYFNYIFI